MPFNKDIADELNILAQFNLDSVQEGIKVHASSASTDAVAATERLYRKGLISQTDGGYLTELGREAAEHTQGVLCLLRNES